MGIIRGVLGKIDQSVGDVTFTQWKGRNVVKQKVPARNTSNSPAQAAQRLKFGELGKLARALAPGFRVGFRNAATTTTEYNVFVKRNSDAVVFTDPGVSVNFEEIEVSAGTVTPLTGVVMTGNPTDRTIKIVWANNSDGNDAQPTDLVYIIALQADSYRTATSLGMSIRSAGAAGIVLQTPDGDGGAWYVYAFTRRAMSTATSNSIVQEVAI